MHITAEGESSKFLSLKFSYHKHANMSDYSSSSEEDEVNCAVYHVVFQCHMLNNGVEEKRQPR